MKVTRRCEYVLEDGHKCNVRYSHDTRKGARKHCDMHLGNEARLSHLQGHHGLVRSRNRYASVANAETMQEWVKHKMNMEPQEKEKISSLERRIERLESIIESVGFYKKGVKAVLRKEMKGSWFKEIVDGLIVKRFQKSFHVRGEEE